MVDCFVTAFLAMTYEARAAEPLAGSIAEPMLSCALRNDVFLLPTVYCLLSTFTIFGSVI